MRAPIVLLATFLLATSAFPADLDVVRSNFVGYTTAAGADRTAPRMRDALGALEGTARSVTAPGYLLSDGSWTDINYKEIPSGSWSPWEHTKRLVVMAKAYKTPGTPLYRDPVLLGQINAALAYVNTFYGKTVLPQGNWWFWTMGIPLDLGPTLVLMRGEVPQQTYDDLVFAMQLRIGTSPTMKGIVGPTPTGENLVWSCFTHLSLGLLKDDPAILAAVRDAMASVTLPVAYGLDGMKADGSFHQHGPQLYTGGYGASFANDVARYALLTRNSAYELPASSLNPFSDYVADGIAWSLYGNWFDVSVIGREVARPSTTGYNGIAALLQASQVPSTRISEIRASATKMLQTWGSALPPELAALATIAETSGWTPSSPSGFRHYYNSDYTIARRPNWFASVKMFSSRTKSGEKTNEENLLGSRQSDGRFALALTGDEYFGRDVWPALDWTRLPGITVEQKADAADATYGFGTRSFAGGTGDGRNGASAMELAPLNSQLTAKKAWFFFDDAIVFLTNSISSSSTNRVETIVNQWPLTNPAAPLTTGATWAHCENIGYWFPYQPALQAKRETRTGAWATLGASTDTTQKSMTFLTMWIDHGTTPVLASAEYAIVPGISADAMRAWTASAPLAIDANNGYVSSVRDGRTGARGIVFWTANASIDGIQSDAQAILWMRGNDLWLADPNASTTAITRITIPGRYMTKDAKYSTTSRSTTIEVPRNGGKTVHITLTPIPKRRSA